MNNNSGFNALATELYHLIAEELKNLGSIYALTRVSKRAYAAYNPLLYRNIESPALSTLAQTEKSRLPLDGPHPASFVKRIRLNFPFEDDPELIDEDEEREKAKKRKGPVALAEFKKLVPAAMDNVVFYAPHTGIKSIEFQCFDLSLAEAFNKVDFCVFSSLEKVLISCPFPTVTLRRSRAMAEALSCASLVSFALVFDQGNDIPDPNTISKLLRHVQRNCPNIQHLGLAIPEMKAGHSPKPIQRVLDDPSFVFPLLKKFYLLDSRDQDEPCRSFLIRHPSIEIFEYVGGPLNGDDFAGHLDPLILPNVVQTTAFLHDGISLCASNARPIEQLCLLMLPQFFPDDWDDRLKAALEGTKTLRRLVVYDEYDFSAGGIGLYQTRAFTAACPGLTHFECTLDVVTGRTIASLREFYSTVVSNLPALKHLKVKTLIAEYSPASCTLCAVRQDHLTTLDTATHDHRALETVEVMVFSILVDGLPGLRARYCFVKEVKGLDGGGDKGVGGRGGIVLAKKEDREEFGKGIIDVQIHTFGV
ncbi:hypothetical protein GYMLUDRAFT_50517 [Collybiopsis luxurians FD-317 M1]|uniref:F-box domain-containing protein n=1 Tax=Collybiopsis luxurians FD-317 M1 TaxID=944289 RepID=A0A0D0BB23_9AGAR|nr:hypothetical protein GYMLUDRAFT_50517 [Collybiopsis luxurians FD-317 M1]